MAPFNNKIVALIVIRQYLAAILVSFRSTETTNGDDQIKIYSLRGQTEFLLFKLTESSYEPSGLMPAR
jgi:hypothetical protein